MDPLDGRILSALQENGRMTNQQIAERVGLSASACLRRIRTLEATGVIEGYGVRLSMRALGYPQTVFVEITLTSQQGADLERFEAAASRTPQIMDIHLMSGDADYLLRLAVRDTADYERLHREVLTNLPGVHRIRSSFALRTVSKRAALPIAIV